MYRPIVYLCSLLLLWTATACRNASNKLLLAGSGWNKIVIVDKASKQIEWEHALEKGWECNSAVVTPEGNILFSYARGAKLINRNHEELWNMDAPADAEMQTAKLLPDGNYLLAWCGHPAVILEVNAAGEVLSETEYETGIASTHAQFRQIDKNADGNYLLPLFATHEVREVSPAGELVQTTVVEGNPFTTLAQADGSYWVACGDAHALLRVDLRTGERLERYADHDIAGVSLFFVAGLAQAPDGGLYVCNWQGHDKHAVEAESPQLFQIDAQGQPVWTLNDNQAFGLISTVFPFRE